MEKGSHLKDGNFHWTYTCSHYRKYSFQTLSNASSSDVFRTATWTSCFWKQSKDHEVVQAISITSFWQWICWVCQLFSSGKSGSFEPGGTIYDISSPPNNALGHHRCPSRESPWWRIAQIVLSSVSRRSLRLGEVRKSLEWPFEEKDCHLLLHRWGWFETSRWASGTLSKQSSGTSISSSLVFYFGVQDKKPKLWNRSIPSNAIPVAIDPGKKGGLLTAKRGKDCTILLSCRSFWLLDVTYTQREWRGRSGAFASQRKAKNLGHHDDAIYQYQRDRANVPTSKVSSREQLLTSLRTKYALYTQMVAYGSLLCHRRVRHTSRIMVPHLTSRLSSQPWLGRNRMPWLTWAVLSFVEDKETTRAISPTEKREPNAELRQGRREDKKSLLGEMLRGSPIWSFRPHHRPRSLSSTSFICSCSLANFQPRWSKVLEWPFFASQRELHKCSTLSMCLCYSFVHTQTCSFCHCRMDKHFFSPKGNRVYRLKRCANTNCLTKTLFSGVLSIVPSPFSIPFRHILLLILSQSKVLHRDKNACRNIAFLFKAEAEGKKHRPSCFADQQSNCLCFISSASPRYRGDLSDKGGGAKANV